MFIKWGKTFPTFLNRLYKTFWGRNHVYFVYVTSLAPSSVCSTEQALYKHLLNELMSKTKKEKKHIYIQHSKA